MNPFALKKYWVFLFYILTISCQGQKKTEAHVIRQPAVSGSFYPSDPKLLIAKLTDLFKSAGNPEFRDNIAAIIVPHAGYIFSGEIAASAYSLINPEKEYTRVFIIGTSHHVYLNGASLYNLGDFKTPLGIVEVDTSLTNQLISKFNFFESSVEAHKQEHSIEVQLPFLQYQLKKKFKIIPIIIGTQSEEMCRKIAKALEPYFNNENLFVISADFSHYPSYYGAKVADKATGDAIATNSPDNFLKALKKNESAKIPGLLTSCCAWSSVLTLLHLSSENKGIEINHIRYSNSGDSEAGDTLKVVGYHSFVFARTNQSAEPEVFTLSKEDKIELLKIARNAIESRLQKKRISYVDESLISEALNTKCGAFVTLKKNGSLRGCVGQFKPSGPLYKCIVQVAETAAFEDVRFNPVQLYEMKSIEIEISVLTPLKRIKSIDEFELGKHGIYMVKGTHSGTFLPQVAEETGWNREEFLGNCALEKAGIGYNGWKDADLYIYEALIFSEKELTHE